MKIKASEVCELYLENVCTSSQYTFPLMFKLLKIKYQLMNVLTITDMNIKLSVYQ
jgi:hypothetical protein